MQNITSCMLEELDEHTIAERQRRRYRERKLLRQHVSEEQEQEEHGYSEAPISQTCSTTGFEGHTESQFRSSNSN